MRPPWRAPRWSAERRAVSAETAPCSAEHGQGWCASRRSASLLSLGRSWEGLSCSGVAKLGCKDASRERECFIRTREAGRGTIRSSRSERRMVEGASDSTLHFGFRRRPDAQRTTTNFTLRRVPRPFHHPAAQGGPPSPFARGRKSFTPARASARPAGRASHDRQGVPPRGRYGRCGRVRERAPVASAAVRSRHAARPE